MKLLLPITFAVLTFFVNTPRAHALFGHVTAEKERRQDAEQRLNQAQQQLGEQQQIAKEQQHLIGDQQKVVEVEQKLTTKWQTTAFVLGVSAILALIVGTAIGSRGKHHAATGK